MILSAAADYIRTSRPAQVVCCVCRRGPADADGGVTVYRINPKGVPGIWACDAHRPAGQHVDPAVREIVQIIEDGE